MSKLQCLLITIFVATATSLRGGEKTKEAPIPEDESKTMQKDLDVDLEAVMNECNQTFRIEMSFLEALNDSGTFPDETDKTPKCYMRCFLEKIGVASLEGEYNATRAADVFARERSGRTHDDLEDSAKSCTDRSESCKCERAYNFMRCLVERDIEKHEAPYKGDADEDVK